MKTRAMSVAAAAASAARAAAASKDDEDRCEFRILSDLHLEFYPSADALLATIPWNPERDARSFLLLAGDVGYPLGADEGGKYRALLAAFAARFRGVFLVAGNHEYYQGAETPATMADVDAALDALCRELHRPSRPVVFLQKQTWALVLERADGSMHTTQLLGCTLWSPVTAAASAQMNDRNYMGVDAPWIRAVHTEHAGWLRRTLSPSSSSLLAQHEQQQQQPEAAAGEEVRTVVVPAGEEEEGAAAAATSNTTLIRADGSVEAAASTEVFDRRVVMTHHLPIGAPSPTSLFGHLVVAASRDSAYYADLFRRGDWPEDAYPDLWVCGHLHSQARCRVEYGSGSIGSSISSMDVISCCHGYSVGQLAEASRMDELAWRPTQPVYCRDAAKLIDFGSE